MVDGEVLVVPLLFTSLLSVGMAWLAWKMSDLRSKRPFVILLLLVAVLSFSYLMELITPTLASKLTWNGIGYVANAFIPVVYLVFVLTFVGKESSLDWSKLAALSVIPLITLTLVWTDYYIHNLFYLSVSLSDEALIGTYVPTYGPWFYVHSLYSFALGGVSFMVLLGAFLRSSRMHRKQIRLIMVSAILPVVVFCLAFAGIAPVPLAFGIVISYLLSSSLIFLGTFQYELFDVVPLALDTVVESMRDGVIVLDNKFRILHLNPSAAAILGTTQETAYATSSDNVLPGLKQAALEAALVSGKPLDLSIPREGREYYYDVLVTAMTDQGGHRTGLLLILRDVDEERRMKESLRNANTRLNMMSLILRHDTLNQVGIIRGYSELISTGGVKQGDAARYGERIKDAVKYIEHQFNLAQQYQGLGSSQPSWQWLQFVLARAKSTGSSEGLTVRAELGQLSVLADPLLEKVFAILLDNTQHHGRHADTVKISYRIEEGRCMVVYEDNGIGVPTPLKECIFKRDFRTDGGMGLHVARQIMEATGGKMVENGQEGQGARFELTFPEGCWKEERTEALDVMKGGTTAKAQAR